MQHRKKTFKQSFFFIANQIKSDCTTVQFIEYYYSSGDW